MPIPSKPSAPLDERTEAAKAIRFLLIKAAIFIGIPIVAAAVAVFLTLR